MIEKIKQLVNMRPKEWRYGQAVFNYAFVLFPEETDKLRGGEFDCYYNNDNVNIFLEKLCMKLN